MCCLAYSAFVLFSSALVLGRAEANEQALWEALAIRGTTAKLFPGSTKRPMNVKMTLSLQTLSDYDPIQGTVRVGYWIDLQWNDPSLRWDPERFGNINQIIVPHKDIWVPDIVPYQRMDAAGPLSGDRAVVQADGSVLWVPHLVMRIICEDVGGGPPYPRDRKACTTKFGSWVYHGGKVNLSLGDDPTLVDQLNSAPLRSSGWTFVNATQTLQVVTYECCPDPYISVLLNITIARADNYYSMAVSVPGAVTGLLVSLLYLLPPSSPARVVSQTVCLLILVLLAVVDLRLMGSTAMLAPAAHYFVWAMVLDLVALAWSVATATVWAQTEASVDGSTCLAGLVKRLECVCCLPGDKHRDRSLLSDAQRLFLALDRLLFLASLLLFALLFGFLGA